MTSRLATVEEVDTWQDQGWVLLDGIVGTDEIDAVLDDLHMTFPATRSTAAIPKGRRSASWAARSSARKPFVWPDDGPGFRPEQQRWSGVFPFRGKGRSTGSCVHPSIVDFAERALGGPDIRLYQIHLTAKYEGITNYEQPMHTDRNHSWLPAVGAPPWWNLEGFLYLSDVTEADNPTRVVSTPQSPAVSPGTPVLMPDRNPDIYAAERPAVGRARLATSPTAPTSSTAGRRSARRGRPGS